MADYAIHDTTLEDIADTIRKKDGTVALIDPADYADRINLMGMLEEKTVSGSIAHITDGADAVPLKSWGVSLPASLSGYSSVECTQTEKNLLDWSNTSQTINQVTFTVNSDGTITVNGTATGGDASFYATASTYYAMKAGTYKISGCPTGGSNTTFFINETTKGVTDMGSGATLTLTENANIRLRITIRNGYNADNMTFSPMIEAGSSVTTFEAYNGTTQTANLGRTIYGGAVDAVTGEGTETVKRVKISDLSWIKQTAGGRDFFITSSAVDGIKSGAPKTIICDVLPYDGEITVAAMTNKSLASWTTTLRIYDTDITDTTELMAAYGNGYIVYELATAEDFTFDPISPAPETALGTNNFWADAGDSSVTYRGQGTVTVYPNAEEASF